MPLLRISAGLIALAFGLTSIAYGAPKQRSPKAKSSSLIYDATAKKRTKTVSAKARKISKKSRRVKKSKPNKQATKPALTIPSRSRAVANDPVKGKRLFVFGLFGTFTAMGLLIVSIFWRQRRRNEIIRKLIIQGTDSSDYSRGQNKPFKLNEPVRPFEGLPFSRHELNEDEATLTTDTLLRNSPYTPSPINSPSAHAGVADSQIEDQPAHTKEVKPLSAHSNLAPEKIEEGKVTVSSSFKEDKVDSDELADAIDQTVVSSVPLQFAVLPDTKPREEDWRVAQSMIPDGSSSGKAS